MKNAKNDSLEFRRALQLANRCLKKYEESGAEQELEEKSKKKYREPGAGRKHTALEVRQVAFKWFIDVWGSLKGRLPKKPMLSFLLKT